MAVVIALAAVNLYTETAEWITLALVTLVGLVGGVKARALCLFRRLRTVSPGLVLLARRISVAMLLPQRGEWVLGGWDPGIYVNQGVSLEPHRQPAVRAGSLFSPDLATVKSPCSRGRRIPTWKPIPLSPWIGAPGLQPFFFPGTPSLIALLYRCGGLRAATRVNDFAGILAALVFAAAALGLMRRGPGAFFALAALVAQPLWLYHAHFPTSEMLQLLLLSGLALAFPLRARSPGAAVLRGHCCARRKSIAFRFCRSDFYSFS